MCPRYIHSDICSMFKSSTTLSSIRLVSYYTLKTILSFDHKSMTVTVLPLPNKYLRRPFRLYLFRSKEIMKKCFLRITCIVVSMI